MERAAAVLLNLILLPGAGHHALGRTWRGVPWLVVSLATPALLFIHPLAFVAVFLGARVASAVEVALLRPGGAIGFDRLVITFAGALVVTGALLFGTRAFLVEGFTIPTATMEPTLKTGDHVLISKIAYRIGDPARGDLAVFVNPCEPDKVFAKRIVALGGDTVEIRCDTLYVNGVEAKSAPLREDCSYWDRSEEGGAWRQQPCAAYVETVGEKSYELVYPPERRELDAQRAGGAMADVEGDRDFPQLRVPTCDPLSDPRSPEDRQGALGKIEPVSGAPGGACRRRAQYSVPPGHVFVLGDNRWSSSDSRAWGPVPVANLKGRVSSVWLSEDPRTGDRLWDRVGPVE